jgi:peroxiredoxin
MKKSFIYIIFVGCLLVGCQRKAQFCLSWQITQAGGSMLYLEHVALTHTSTIDSCILEQDGTFHFVSPAPEHPDFYRLRIDNKSLILAVDSTEHITISTTHDSLSLTKSILGSPASLSMAELRATSRLGDLDSLRHHAQQIIFANPRSLAAYYAVFFKYNGQFIWDITNRTDRRMFQTVATSFLTWMPQYERTKALYSQVSNMILLERNTIQQAAVQKLIQEADNTFLDIQLPDDKGKNQTLSSLRGKVIVLDYSAIDMEQSHAYIFELRDLYNKYHARGMEIYAVSLDQNRLRWEVGVQNLPWINVFAGDNAAQVLMRYNVQSIPTLFLLDRKGNVQGRYSDFKQLDADIRKYL